jgi:hypothetical protein
MECTAAAHNLASSLATAASRPAQLHVCVPLGLAGRWLAASERETMHGLLVPLAVGARGSVRGPPLAVMTLRHEGPSVTAAAGRARCHPPATVRHAHTADRPHATCERSAVPITRCDVRAGPRK